MNPDTILQTNFHSRVRKFREFSKNIVVANNSRREQVLFLLLFIAARVWIDRVAKHSRRELDISLSPVHRNKVNANKSNLIYIIFT